MKKIGLGLALLLFAIVLALCSSGMEIAVLVIGVLGLGAAFLGYLDKSK